MRFSDFINKMRPMGSGNTMFPKMDKQIQEFLFGTDPSVDKLPIMDEGQDKLFGQQKDALGQGNMYGQGMDVLKQYLDPNSDAYQNIAAPYMQQFNEKIIPQLSERFSGFGSESGALSSSAFGQSIGSAGSDLMAKLSAMVEGGRRSAATEIFGEQGKAIGQKPFGYREDPGKSGNLDVIIQALMAALKGGG